MKRFTKQLRQGRLGIVVALVALAAVGGLGWSQWRQYTRPPSDRLLITGLDPELETDRDYFEAGNTEFDQKHYEEAIADYDQALTLNPAFAEAYNNRAYTYMTLEKYGPALDDLNRAIELRPNYVNALINRGDIYNYYYEMDTAKAMTDYDRVLALDPTMANRCGHRLLAEHNGWNLGMLGEFITKREEAGC